MADDFKYDVFLSYSSKDKDVVRPIAERLRADGLRVWFDEWVLKSGDNIPANVEQGLDHSRVLVVCMSTRAFGSEWAQLEASAFPFRDPLNNERRFILLRLDETPIKDSLPQLLYFNWFSKRREKEYAKLLEAVRPTAGQATVDEQVVREHLTEKAIRFEHKDARISAYAFSPDGKQALTGSSDCTVRLWDLETERCLRVFEAHTSTPYGLAWSPDQRFALSSGLNESTVRLFEVKSGRCVRRFPTHASSVLCLAWSNDGTRAVFGTGGDGDLEIWDLQTALRLRVLKGGHTDFTRSVTWSADQLFVFSGAQDDTIRKWDAADGHCMLVLDGHSGPVYSLALGKDQRSLVSGSGDNTLRLWDLDTGRCLSVLEGHTSEVLSVAWSHDQRCVLSGSSDGTARLWDVATGLCLRVLDGHTGIVRGVAWDIDQRRAFSGDENGVIRAWALSAILTEAGTPEVKVPALSSAPDQVQYTNAKVLVVGDTSAGKTGLAHRLATGMWKPSDGSTVGAWSTQWALPETTTTKKVEGLEQEIWLWDFGGQADQRLVHQLYMDRAALILLLFDADKEDVLPGLREWQTALRRCVPTETPLVLVAGRIDAGFRASRAKIQNFANEQGFRYFETSAKEGTNCEELSRAITEVIPWGQMEKRTSPRIFKLIKDEILKLRDEGQVLNTFKELREVLWQRLPNESRFTDETLKTVIGLLDGPGVVKELDYGTYVLLQPEWINAYAQAVIRTLRQEPSELGALPLRSIEEGKLLFQTVDRDGGIVNMKRLPEVEERVVLREMERQLEERGLCLRQSDKLVFPSHCGRERPEKLEYPSVFVSYAVEGYLDDLYATLVVKLADCESFKLKELWRDAADFETLKGDHHMGIKLTREAAGSGDISVYFAPGVTIQEQVIFAKYIHAHLQARSEQVQRLRYYVCPHCGTPKGNPQVMMQKLLSKKKVADVECDICEKRFNLWDDLEILFASDEVREQVEGLQAIDAVRLDSRRKGKLLALEVISRITSADQKCFEIPGTEDEGIDIQLEFTDDDGKGTGKLLFLQLKSGNSHLRKRKDGVEVFAIKEQRWVDYWLKQTQPVMLVIGTFARDDERSLGRDKLEFDEVRWMEISSYLKRESQNGKKPVKQIEFKGERLDMTSVRRWRDRILS